MSQIVVVGRVKAWEVSKSSHTLGVAIPKMASRNLNLDAHTYFEVTMNLKDKTMTFRPVEKEQQQERRKSPAS